MESDPLQYVQDTFSDTLAEVESEYKPIARESMLRRFWAYSLKAITVFSGIAIAAGVADGVAHVLGIIIASTVALDSLFSNHERMIAVSKASQAYARVLKGVRRTHQLELMPILQEKASDPDVAKEKLIALVKNLTERLHDECSLIESALDNMNLKALHSLALDKNNERKR